jgi:ornithine carbamoyltransferase
MCHSYIHAASILDFKLNIASPTEYQPNQTIVKNAGECIRLFDNALDAASNADLIVTDVWASMGQEEEQKQRSAAFKDYQVNAKIMSAAHNDALFMHCLPAHRGEEVSADVMDGPQSIVFSEAENRLHAQKALLEFLLSAK